MCVSFNMELNFELKKGLERVVEGVRVAAFQSGGTGGDISHEGCSLHTLF